MMFIPLDISVSGYKKRTQQPHKADKGSTGLRCPWDQIEREIQCEIANVPEALRATWMLESPDMALLKHAVNQACGELAPWLQLVGVPTCRTHVRHRQRGILVKDFSSSMFTLLVQLHAHCVLELRLVLKNGRNAYQCSDQLAEQARLSVLAPQGASRDDVVLAERVRALCMSITCELSRQHLVLLALRCLSEGRRTVGMTKFKKIVPMALPEEFPNDKIFDKTLSELAECKLASVHCWSNKGHHAYIEELLAGRELVNKLLEYRKA